MSNQSLVGTLPIYAQHLAELTGVKVLVEGHQAYTDGNVVNVPFTEHDLPLSFGYVAHECSHVRNTDMAVFAAAKIPFRKRLLNILEDIRIERLSMDQYPGTESDLNYLVKTVLGETLDAAEVEAKQPLAIVHDTLLLAGRWMVLKQDLEQPAQVMLAAQESLLGKALSEQIMQKVSGVLRCVDTQAVLNLTDELIGMLPSPEDKPEEPQPQEQPEQPKDQQQGSEEGDQQQDQNQGGGDGEGEGEEEKSDSTDGNAGSAGDEAGEEGDSTQSEQKSSSGDQGDNQDDAAGDGQGNQGDQSQAGDAESGNAQGGSGASDCGTAPAAQDLREQAMQATAQALHGLISEVGDAAAAILSQQARRAGGIRPYTLAGREENRSEREGKQRVQLGLEQSAGLRQTLNGLLQAQVDSRVRLKRQGKRIDTSRIAMLKGGETRVFRSKAPAERQSAAIEILLDKSGSMADALVDAEAAVYAVLQAMEGLPLVSTGAMSFPSYNSKTGIGCCALIKGPKERLSAAVNNGGFGACAFGGTPLAEALWPAAVEVLHAKGERKILFVLTDGEPTPGTEGEVRKIVTRCKNSGIEVVALGFGQANGYLLGQLFTRYVAVGSVGNLKNALFQVVREALTA